MQQQNTHKYDFMYFSPSIEVMTLIHTLFLLPLQLSLLFYYFCVEEKGKLHYAHYNSIPSYNFSKFY